jgi:hypothetical protein
MPNRRPGGTRFEQGVELRSSEVAADFGLLKITEAGCAYQSGVIHLRRRRFEVRASADDATLTDADRSVKCLFLHSYLVEIASGHRAKTALIFCQDKLLT